MCVMLETHCASAVRPSVELNGSGSSYIRQGRHSHGNTADFANCFFIMWLIEINPNQNPLPASIISSVQRSLKLNERVRLTRQRASCQSTVPLSRENKKTISIAKRQTHLRRILVFPWDPDQRWDPPFPCSRLQACCFPIMCKSGRWWEHLHSSLCFISFQDASLWSAVKPDTRSFQLWLQLFWPSHAHFPL